MICYTAWSYGLYKTIEEVLVALPVAMVSQLIVHYGCGLQGNFFYDWMVYFAVGQCGAALAYVVASASKNIDVANAALPVYNVLQILFFRFAHARTANSKRLGMVATNALRPLWMESPNVESFQPRFLHPERGLLRRTSGVKSLSATTFYTREVPLP